MDPVDELGNAARKAAKGTVVGSAIEGGVGGAAAGAAIGEAASLGAAAVSLATGVAIGSSIPIPVLGSLIGAFVGAMVALANAFRVTPEEARAWLVIVRSAPGIMAPGGAVTVDPSPAAWAKYNKFMRERAGETGPDKLEDPGYIAQVQIAALSKNGVAGAAPSSPDAARAMLAVFRANPALAAARADVEPGFQHWYRDLKRVAGDTTRDVDSVEKAWFEKMIPGGDPTLGPPSAATSLRSFLGNQPWLERVETYQAPHGSTGLLVLVRDEVTQAMRVAVPPQWQGYPVELRRAPPNYRRAGLVIGGALTLGAILAVVLRDPPPPLPPEKP